MARTRRYAAGRNITIGDRAGLAQILREVIASRFGGSVARAARETGVPRSLLRRIQAGTQRSIRTDNVGVLRQLVGWRKREIESTLIAGPARERLDRYDAWLEAAITAAQLGLVTLARGGAADPLQADNFNRRLRYFAVLRQLQRDFSAEWEPLLRAVTRRHYKARAVLAFARVVAPLLDTYDSAGIERSYEEFSNAELRTFIKAGVARERLLLKRTNDPERSHTAPMRDPQLTRRQITAAKLGFGLSLAPPDDALAWMTDIDGNVD